MSATYSDESDVEELDAPKHFRFFALPSELRVRIYEFVLVFPGILDLDPSNFRKVAPRLRLFLASRRMHEEAYRVFYGSNIFRLFPIHGRFFHTKPKNLLLARLPQKYRAEISKVELRVGTGFTKPPRGWVINEKLGLNDLKALRLLKVFVEFDPASSDIFEGFRKSKEFYTLFCVQLLKEIFLGVGSIQDVEFDVDPTVAREGPLATGMLEETRKQRKRICWSTKDASSKNVKRHQVTGLEQSLMLMALEVP